MPSFSCSSSIRVASQDHVLRLKITHNLVHGSPSDVVHSVKQRLPKGLDVLWLSDIAIAISGSLDGREVAAHDIARSGLAHHLQKQLKANADRLGLNNVSRPFIDDADGLAKVTLTPSRPLPPASRPHANLASLHLTYIWGSTSAGRNSDAIHPGYLVEEVDPFSPALLLPAEVLLNRVTEQFLINHVVGRYPLIFGPWCKRLDLEKQYFPSIGQSMVQIMARSRNDWFLSKCKRLLKIARCQHKFVIQTSTAALCACTSTDADGASDLEEEIDNLCATPPVLTDPEVLCESLEQHVRVGVPQRRFKPAATPQFITVPQDEDDNLLLPSIRDPAIDNWVELSDIDIGTPLCVRQSDSHETWPADVDIFATEDGAEEDMWRLDEVDMECEFDTQSDKSLISGTISLAGNTTGSPGTCDFAPCVDYHETGSRAAAGGLRYNVSQLAVLEDAENVIDSVSESHARQEHEQQLMQDMETWEMDMMDSESFEILDSCSEQDSELLKFEEEEEEEEEDLDSGWPGVAER